MSNQKLITDKDCEEFIMVRGKGWVCEIDNQIVGFSIADLKDHNIRAFFIQPEFENSGIGSNCTALCLTGILLTQKSMFGWELHQIQEQKLFTENRVWPKLELTEKNK